MYRFYFARCMNIFNSLPAQLVNHDVHTTRKIKSIHAIFYHILSFYLHFNGLYIGKSSESVQCAITDPCLRMRHRPST